MMGQDSIQNLDKILDSLKCTIERRVQSSRLGDEVLELTDVVENNVNSPNHSQLLTESEIKSAFKEALRPYLQSWLTNNLPAIARDVIEAEVKALVAKNEMTS